MKRPWMGSHRFVGRVFVVALVIAAAPNGCGRSDQTPAAGKEPLATVGRHTITRADVERRLGQLDPKFRSQFASPERQVEFLNLLVEEKLIVLAAEGQKLDKEAELASMLADARSQIIAHFYSEKMLNPLAVPDSIELSRYYDENPDEFKVAERVAAKQIVVANETDARALRKLLLRGASFDSLVKARSIDTQTRNLGGALGFLSRGVSVRGLGPDSAFVEAVMAVPMGEISQPIRTPKGYHLVLVESHEPERVRELNSAAVKESVTRKLMPAKYQAIRERLVDSLRLAYTVKVDTLALLGDDDFQAGQAKALFDRAQGTNDPNERLKVYDEILAEHGNTKYAAQAQFMIGFVYAEELKDRDRARAALAAVIERYPDSELVDSARWMLKNIDDQAGAGAGTAPGVQGRGGTGGD